MSSVDTALNPTLGGTLTFGQPGDVISTDLYAIVVAVSSGAGALPPYTFNTPSTEWIINHNLNRMVNAAPFTPGGIARIAEVTVSLNQVRINFELPSTGFVILS
jgi:hypothetical protein